MSDHLERILLINIPDFVDEWVLKSTTPCGDLIDRTEKNPSDPSKMVIFTKGQENALKIARTLDNCSLFGSVIQAWCVFTKPPADASKAVTNSTVNEIQRESEKKAEEKTPRVNSSKNPERQQAADTKPAKMAEDEIGHLHRGRKRRSSAVVGSTEPLEHSRRGERAGSPFKTPGRKSSKRKGRSRSRDSWPLSEQAKDASSGKSTRCRFCHRSGHATWMCREKAEYYKVAWTTKGINPPGYEWPESSIVKVEELYAGPVIEYIERRHLQKEKMNREQIRIMFAWLTNYIVCHDCGAAGHVNTKKLCKYVPLDRPVTKEEIDQYRKPFGRRMRGIRDRVSFGELQRLACSANDQFRHRVLEQDHRPLTGNTLENPPKGTSAESTDKNDEQNPPEEFSPILFVPDGKRIKIEPPDGYDQVSDDHDEDDVVFVRTVAPRKRPTAGHLDPSGMTQGTSKSIKGTLEVSNHSTFVHIE